MSAAIEQRNQEATLYVGNLDEKVTEELLWELMLQGGPVVNVHMPKDKISGVLLGYGFVEFRSEEDAEYAMKVMNMIKLFGKPMKMNRSSQDKKQFDVGANIFIGNLDPEVDEKLLYDTFSAFGGIQQTPKIMRDADTGESKGFGFVSFDSFESSDLSIECMNNQFLCNRAITVQYAYKKDTYGERHGSSAERLMAASVVQQKFKPHTIFSSGDSESMHQMGGINPLLGAQQMQYNQMSGVPSMPMSMMPPPPPGHYDPAPPSQYGAPPPPPPPFMSSNIPPHRHHQWPWGMCRHRLHHHQSGGTNYASNCFTFKFDVPWKNDIIIGAS